MTSVGVLKLYFRGLKLYFRGTVAGDVMEYLSIKTQACSKEFTTIQYAYTLKCVSRFGVRDELCLIWIVSFKQSGRHENL